MKRTIAGLLALALLLGLAACSRDNGEDKTLAFPIAENPGSLDPQIVSRTAERIVINNCFEGLVRMGEDGRILPGAAESWTVSPDGLSYSFRLRRDAQWMLFDGNARTLGDALQLTEKGAERVSALRAKVDFRVTAQDFVFALRRAVDPAIHAPDAEFLFALQNAEQIYKGKAKPETLGVAAPDDFTLTVTLRQASGDFLRVLTTAVAMPCHEIFYEATQGRYGLDAANLLCNGPFYLSRWNEGRSLRLSRSTDYRGSSPVLPAAVTLTVDAESGQYAEKLRNGSYAAVALPESAERNWGADFQLQRRPNCVLSLLFHCGTFGNAGLRAALAGTVDRAALAEAGQEIPAQGLIPGSCAAGQGSYRGQAGPAEFIPYEEPKARQRFQEGLEALGRQELSFTLLCTAEYETQMRKLLQQWQQVFGVNCKGSVQVLPAQELEERLRAKNFDIAFVPLYAKADTALGYLESFSSGHADNPCGYRSSTFDKLLETIAAAPSDAEALRGCKQAEAHLLQNGVALPLFARESIYVLGKGVSGIYFHPDGENVCFIGGRQIG